MEVGTTRQHQDGVKQSRQSAPRYENEIRTILNRSHHANEDNNESTQQSSRQPVKVPIKKQPVKPFPSKQTGQTELDKKAPSPKRPGCDHRGAFTPPTHKEVKLEQAYASGEGGKEGVCMDGTGGVGA